MDVSDIEIVFDETLYSSSPLSDDTVHWVCSFSGHLLLPGPLICPYWALNVISSEHSMAVSRPVHYSKFIYRQKLYVNLRCWIWAWQAFCKKTVIHFGPNWAQKTHIAAITNVKLRTVWARIFMPQCKLPGDSSLLWASVWKFYASAIFAWWHHHAMSSAFTVVKVDTAADTRMACFTELVIFCCFLPVYILWICFWLIPSRPKVSWAWWDWPLTWLTTDVFQCCDTVGWVIRPVNLSPNWPIMCRVGR